MDFTSNQSKIFLKKNPLSGYAIQQLTAPVRKLERDIWRKANGYGVSGMSPTLERILEQMVAWRKARERKRVTLLDLLPSMKMPRIRGF